MWKKNIFPVVISRQIMTHSKLEEVAASSTSVICYTVWILIDFSRQESTYCQDLLRAGISTVHVSVDHSLLDNTSHFHLLSQ